MYQARNIVTLLLCFFMLSGCVKENANAPANQSHVSKPTGSTGQDSPSPAAMLKGKKLADFPSATIVDAFDRYAFLAKKEWKLQRSPQNVNIYIDFIGWFDSKVIDDGAKKEGVSEKGLDVKFVVYPDGSFGAAMVSRLEMRNDGKLYAYPIDDLTGILTKIYANKEITF